MGYLFDDPNLIIRWLCFPALLLPSWAQYEGAFRAGSNQRRRHMDEILMWEMAALCSDNVAPDTERSQPGEAGDAGSEDGSLGDDLLDKVSGGMRKAGGDPKTAGKADIIAI
jgi:hypothetical protein